MALRKRIVLVNMFLYVGAGLLGTLMLFVNGWFAVPFLILVATGGIWLMNQRCPRCGASLYRRQIELFGERWSYWAGIAPRHCATCGLELGREYWRRREGRDSATGPGYVQAQSISQPSSVRKRVIIACFLLVVNLVGGLAWAAAVDFRFIYPTAVIALACIWVVFSARRL